VAWHGVRHSCAGSHTTLKLYFKLHSASQVIDIDSFSHIKLYSWLCVTVLC